MCSFVREKRCPTGTPHAWAPVRRVPNNDIVAPAGFEARIAKRPHVPSEIGAEHEDTAVHLAEDAFHGPLLVLGMWSNSKVVFIPTSLSTTQTYKAVSLFVSPSIQHAPAPTRSGTLQSIAPARWPLRSNSTSRATS